MTLALGILGLLISANTFWIGFELGRRKGERDSSKRPIVIMSFRSPYAEERAKPDLRVVN